MAANHIHSRELRESPLTLRMCEQQLNEQMCMFSVNCDLLLNDVQCSYICDDEDDEGKYIK